MWIILDVGYFGYLEIYECLEFEMIMLILHAVYFRLRNYFSSLLIAIKFI